MIRTGAASITMAHFQALRQATHPATEFRLLTNHSFGPWFGFDDGVTFFLGRGVQERNAGWLGKEQPA